MTPILSAAAEIQGFCQREGWSFCIVGGLAVLRWGKPRTTQDVDVTLITGFGAEEPFVDKLLAHFASRIPDAKRLALQNRVLLLVTAAGIVSTWPWADFLLKSSPCGGRRPLSLSRD